MKKYLLYWVLLVFCSCLLVSCSDDKLDLEEKKAMLIGEWYITENSGKIPESGLGYLAHLKFNQDGTGSGYFYIDDFLMKIQMPDFTYNLLDLDGELYLMLKYTTGTNDSLYLLELTDEYLKWKLRRHYIDDKLAIFKKKQ